MLSNSLQNGNPANRLSRTVKVTAGVRSNLSGSETDYGYIISEVPKQPSLTYVLTNATTALKKFVIGDGNGMIAASLGVTLADPTSINGNTAIVEANKAMLSSQVIEFNEITWKASASATQFNNVPTWYASNFSGQLVPDVINLAVAEKNTAQNDLILTTKGLTRLDGFRGLVVDVNASSTLTVTMSPSAYTV